MLSEFFTHLNVIFKRWQDRRHLSISYYSYNIPMLYGAFPKWVRERRNRHCLECFMLSGRNMIIYFE